MRCAHFVREHGGLSLAERPGFDRITCRARRPGKSIGWTRRNRPHARKTAVGRERESDSGADSSRTPAAASPRRSEVAARDRGRAVSVRKLKGGPTRTKLEEVSRTGIEPAPAEASNT
jgi:hypothetical protein